MLLETENLTKQFGGLTAVSDVSLQIAPGDVQAILGPNGAGKTTLFNLLTGSLSPTSGVIRFNGEEVQDLSTEKRVRRGIGRSFQVTNIFPDLTVHKNVRIAVQNVRGEGRNFWSVADNLVEINEEASEILEYIGISEDHDKQASKLSHGEKRQLELGIAVALKPRILLLDEPAAGMSTDETTELITTIQNLSEDFTILLIEHDVDMVFELADKVTVLYEGEILSEGTPEDISQDTSVQDAYLGGEV